MSTEMGFATKAIHAGQDPLQWNHWEVVPPIVMSTTFRQDGPGQTKVNAFYFKTKLVSVIFHKLLMYLIVL